MKVRIFERIDPNYYHGKGFSNLEKDLRVGFLRSHMSCYSDAMLALSGQSHPGNPAIFLTRDRNKNGKFTSGLEQAKIFSERDNKGIIYVFNSGIIDLKGYEDYGGRNIIVREPINLHEFLEEIVVNSEFSDTEEKAKEMLERKRYENIITSSIK